MERLQSTLPRGERHRWPSTISIWLMLQSTLPRGERPFFAASRRSTVELQSTLPRGERQITGPWPCSLRSFNPRSRAGSDSGRYGSRHPQGQLQSTLPRGERRDNHARHCPGGGFNPRSRAGSDYIDLDHLDVLDDASIHAPARGATATKSCCNRCKSFNPRSRAGSDCVGATSAPKPQSFNPRSRAGSDIQNMVSFQYAQRLQSTLPRGERLCPFFAFALQ